MRAKKKAAVESTRVQRLERKRAQSREEILEATRRVILRDGAGVTLDAIAEEVGLTKAALYYYFPSKEALLFEVIHGIHRQQAAAIHDAVEAAGSGAEALSALLRATIAGFAPRMDDFRLAFMHGQVAGPDATKMLPEFFARIRPLNDLAYGGTTKRIEEETNGQTRSGVPPRRLAFLAHMAAIGLLTMKGMVESVGDPLIYSDEQLIADLSKIFAAASEPARPSARRRSS